MKALVLSLALLAVTSFASADRERDWASSVELPKSEKRVRLFNGKNLDGWEGQIAKYWSVEDGVIHAHNDSTVPASTYLLTEKNYRSFRLLLEVKQTRGVGFSPIHSGVAILGEKFLDQGDPFSYRGPLLMFCNDWGIWDLNRRNRIVPAGHSGTWQNPIEAVNDWNRIEVLVVGNRIRMAANGQQVFDFTDRPEMLKPAPIGLQLHSNPANADYHFRGLILTENPEDRLITAAATK